MPNVELKPIEGSSWIESAGYDPETQVLHVKTKKGDAYEYEGVPPEKYVSFTGAKSPGQFFNSKIQSVHVAKKVKV